MTRARTANKRLEPGNPGSKPRRAAALVGLVFLVGLVVALGWWGLSGRDSVRAKAIGETIDIPGGRMMVAEVRPEIMVHAMAPGMTMPDPIPDGHRRFAVDLLFTGGPEGTTIRPGDLYLEGDGLDRIPPHRVAGTVSPLAEGSTLALGVLFQAPLEVANLWIGYRGSDEIVALEGDLGDGHDHGDHDHGDHDHGDEPLEPDVVVGIDDGSFLEASLTVAAGATVGWENRDDGVPHTVTFSEGGPDSGVLQPGETFSVHLDFAGTYGYVCEIHPSMRGRIIVEESS